MASLENMWKAYQKVWMCWIIQGYSIAPGLVDTHIHGFGGIDVMDNNIEGTLHTMSEGLLSTGVTSFLPTTLTSSYEQLLAVTENIGSRYKEATGAKIRGIYFEGPYFYRKIQGGTKSSLYEGSKYGRIPGLAKSSPMVC